MSDDEAYERGHNPYAPGGNALHEKNFFAVFEHLDGEAAAKAEQKQNEAKLGGGGTTTDSGGAFGVLIILAIIWYAFFSGDDKRISPTASQSYAEPVAFAPKEFTTPSGEFSLGADSANGQLVMVTRTRSFPIFGIRMFKNDISAADKSAGFENFAKKIESANAYLTCRTMATSAYKCYLDLGGDKQRRDIAKLALNMGAATSTSDAPDAYKNLERFAQLHKKGNWDNVLLYSNP